MEDSTNTEGSDRHSEPQDEISNALRNAHIVIVEDEEGNRRLLDRLLRRAGATLITALEDARDIEHLFRLSPPDLVLLDMHMPHRDGLEVLEALRPWTTGGNYLPVIMLTGDASSELRNKALSLGARDFVHKPFDLQEVLLRIKNLLETRVLHRLLREQNVTLEVKVAERTRDLEDAQVEILDRLSRAVEFRDGDTWMHTDRVGQLASLLGRKMGLSELECELVRKAAPLHDIGKVGIPDYILLKQGKLTPEEFAIMQTHTVVGARMLSEGRSSLVRMAEVIARSHHEKWDGSGYPDGLKGEEIPVSARLVGIADFFDALSHARPYRPAWPTENVLAEIQAQSGRHFDPEMAARLPECVEELGPVSQGKSDS